MLITTRGASICSRADEHAYVLLHCFSFVCRFILRMVIGPSHLNGPLLYRRPKCMRWFAALRRWSQEGPIGTANNSGCLICGAVFQAISTDSMAEHFGGRLLRPFSVRPFYAAPLHPPSRLLPLPPPAYHLQSTVFHLHVFLVPTIDGHCPPLPIVQP